MFIKPNIPALIWVLVILLLTLLPGDAFPVPPKFMDMFEPDKIVHLFMFGTLVILLLNGFRKQTKYPLLSRFYIGIPVAFGVFLGGITEILQGIMNIGRTASVYDFIANTIGCIMGVYIYKFLHKRNIKYFS
ncbi:MAG: VanZ family protein [Bacteroidota bacterium]